MSLTRNITRLMLTLVLAGWAAGALAAVKMPAVFGSGMVLQREQTVPVWGWAAPGEKVTVSFADQTAESTTGQDGKWKAELKALAASAAPRTLTVKGENTLTFENVLVGEVWVCSGQSNMEMGVTNCKVEGEIAKANDPQMRLFLVEKDTATEPLKDLAKPAAWQVCTPETLVKGGWGGFSAAGYFFGRDLRQKLNVPVGLIGTYWGGTPAQSWTRQAALEGDARLKIYLTQWEEQAARYPEAKKQYDAVVAAIKKSGDKTKRAPWPPQDPVKSANRPANLYNAMIAPLVPFGIRGAIWYQGESNAGNDAPLYRQLFGTMISDWRAQWGQGDFPFLFVQLANFMQREEQPSESSWAVLRETQLKTLQLKNTGMAVIIDIGDAADIHPKDKVNVGKRLSLAALKVAYGQRDVVYSGPIFDKMKIEGGKAVLTFKNTGGGLVSKTGETLKSFAIAGADRKFIWADAKIAGATVEVTSAQVAAPVAVRYAWGNNPEASLFNKEGLPASPFRTDRWGGPARPAGAAKKVKAKTAKK